MEQAIKQWWQKLELRERLFLKTGGTVLTLIIIWAFVWLPYQQSREELYSKIINREQQFLELQQIAAQIKAASKSTANRNTSQQLAARNGRSLLRLADETVRSAGLAAALKRIEPESEQRAQVWLENASFDRLIGWLESLEGSYTVRVSSANISRPANSGSGIVNARIGLIDAP